MILDNQVLPGGVIQQLIPKMVCIDLSVFALIDAYINHCLLVMKCNATNSVFKLGLEMGEY